METLTTYTTSVYNRIYPGINASIYLALFGSIYKHKKSGATQKE